MALEITCTDSQETAQYLALTGQLDALTAPELEAYVEQSLGTQVDVLVFDMQDLSFVSSAGLRVLAKTRKLLKSRKGNLYYVNLSPQVKKVFDIVKATPLADVFANVEELDAYLKAMQDQVTGE